MLRVLKIGRLIRMTKASEKLNRYMQNGAVNLTSWIIFFCLCGHWLACIWHVIADRIDVPAGNEHSWLIVLAKNKNAFTFENGVLNISSLTIGPRYVTALYYVASSLTTCGFGNFAPNTNAEMLFGITSMIFGCLLYAFIFGQVTDIISQMRESSNQYLDNLHAIQQFNKTYRIPKDVGKRAVGYFEAIWAVTKGSDEEKIMTQFPRDLQSDICLHIHASAFKNDAFRNLTPNALRSVSRYFWTLRTSPGDKLVNYGENVENLYFVESGSFEVIHQNQLIGLIVDSNNKTYLIGPGDSFGQRPLSDDGKSLCEVLANSFGIIHSISVEDLQQALILFPEQRDLFNYTLKHAFDITQIRLPMRSIIASIKLKNESKMVSWHIPDIENTEVETMATTNFSPKKETGSIRFNETDPHIAMSELRFELRKETQQMYSKMGVLEAQMRILLKAVRKKSARVDLELGTKLDELEDLDDEWLMNDEKFYTTSEVKNNEAQVMRFSVEKNDTPVETFEKKQKKRNDEAIDNKLNSEEKIEETEVMFFDSEFEGTS